MKEIELKGTLRPQTGKKASKALRKEGFVPCNLYGEKRGEDNLPIAMSFAIEVNAIKKVIYSAHIYVINLVIDGSCHTAILKEAQFHPVTDELLHVDFYEVNPTKDIVVGIPVKLNGLAQGVRDGGRLNLSIRKIKVRAPYPSIPEVLDIDVTNLRLGKSIKVGDLHFEGFELATPSEVIVCSVKTTRASKSASSAEEENSTKE